MGVFGFIENFFFISLLLVFALVVFLVYHFKNRITVAEKKNESMYGLLTAVVKEIKVLRGMFGLGNKEQPGSMPINQSEPLHCEVQSKTTPEVMVPASSNTFDSFVQREKEVITFEISASEEDKVVVSDMDDSELSDSESESDSDSESGTEPDDVFECVDEHIHLDNNLDEPVEEPVVVKLSDFKIEEIISEEPSTPVDVLDTAIVEKSVVDMAQFSVEGESQEEQSTHLAGMSDMNKSRPPVEQLRKMNINQLKTIASQLGITEDVSKMKKPELITLIQQK